MYLNVGVNDFLNFNVVMFESIEVSASSIVSNNFEYLKTLSNFCSVFVLKLVIAVVTKVFNSHHVLVVFFHHNL